MAETISIGIDLGTTNSEISVYRGDNVEVIKNIYGDMYTPSVFGIDKSQNRIVGKKAYEKLFRDSSDDEVKNFRAEIKRLMGTADDVFFTRINASMKAEEISAEILKTLRGDMLRKYPDVDASAAVITIPASFSTLQSEATKRAGNLAGFDYVVLLQEPIAAAIAYGFMNTREENWLVYDLGGGTFDVALVSSKGGTLSVISHNGDNFLGGKDIDWILVDRVIVPAILRSFSFSNLNRGNPRYQSAFAKLKYLAESAKIFLSQEPITTIEIEGIGRDDKGDEVTLAVELRRQEMENLIQPLVDRTIELSRETIKASGLAFTSVQRVVLVGGPTQIPFIQERLKADLGIPVDSSVDPLIVVSQGACRFAISQKIPAKFQKAGAVDASKKKVTIHYDTLTSEVEEIVTGSFSDLGVAQDEHSVQIRSESGFFAGTPKKLRNGRFSEILSLERNKKNLFRIFLADPNGRPVPVDPDTFSITHGLSVTGAPIPYSIGVSLAKKDIRTGFALTENFKPIFRKGSILPLKSEPLTFHTARALKKGEPGTLDIKIFEGESDNPDRDTFICDVKISGGDLPRDLPEDTEIELLLEVNESREVKVDIFIPFLDVWMSARGSVHAEQLNLSAMQDDFRREIQRYEKFKEHCDSYEKSRIETLTGSIRTGLDNAQLDEDEKRKAHKQLKDLKIYLDLLEKEKEMPKQVQLFRENINFVDDTIHKVLKEGDKARYLERLATIRKEGEEAIARNDPVLLVRLNEQLIDFKLQVLEHWPDFWIWHFQKLTDGKHNFSDAEKAQHYIGVARNAMERRNLPELVESVYFLYSLLPPDEFGKASSTISGIK